MQPGVERWRVITRRSEISESEREKEIVASRTGIEHQKFKLVDSREFLSRRIREVLFGNLGVQFFGRQRFHYLEPESPF